MKKLMISMILVVFALALSSCSLPGGPEIEKIDAATDEYTVEDVEDTEERSPDSGQLEIPEDAVGEYMLSSGAGGWFVNLTLNEDGTFTIDGSDSNMGETGPGYPDGTTYVYDGKGKFNITGKTDDQILSLEIASYENSKELDSEWFENVNGQDMRMISTDPWLFDNYVLLPPGTDIASQLDGKVHEWITLSSSDYIIDSNGLTTDYILVNTDDPENTRPYLKGWPY